MGQKMPNNDRIFVFGRLRELIAGELRTAIDMIVPGRTLALNNPLVRVHEYEQYPKGENERKEVERVNDPITGANPSNLFVSFIELNQPSVHEEPLTSEQNTRLTIDMPATFVVGVRTWKKAGWPFPSSAQLFEAVFAKCGERIKEGGRNLAGYDNVTHDYLSQTFADTDRDEDSGEPISITGGWLLSVKIAGAKT